MPRRAVTIAALLLAAGAQARPALIETNLPDVKAVQGPVSGFDPVRASDEARERYGFPPPPDAVRAPVAYAGWARAMHASRSRIVPHLRASPVLHGPVRNLRHGVRLGHDLQDVSDNWSGTVLTTAGVGSFGATSLQMIGTNMLVPQAAQAFGTCRNDWDYSAEWVGLDGAYGYSSDVLQAGVEADAYCGYGQTSTEYYAWYEWYPAGTVTIENLTILPGEEMYIVVWATSATQGYAYVVDLNTGVSVAVSITPPAGTQLIGNSAEYITERPAIGSNNKLSNLARYTLAYFSTSYAFDGNKNASFANFGTYPVQATALTMTDSSGNPLSTVDVLGGASLSTSSAGTAQGTPP